MNLILEPVLKWEIQLMNKLDNALLKERQKKIRYEILHKCLYFLIKINHYFWITRVSFKVKREVIQLKAMILRIP